jgi:hypothetical protein
MQGRIGSIGFKVEWKPFHKSALKGHGFTGSGQTRFHTRFVSGQALQAAEKLDSRHALYQGTASAVPHMQQNNIWALAPEGGIERNAWCL